MRLGILGCGSFIQRRILPVVKLIDGLEVTCIHKQNLSEAKKLAYQHDIPYAVSSRDDLIHHPKVDAVFIATPNDCHEEDAIACAKALKPTLCEKPLAPTSQAIIRMQKAFKHHGIPLFVGHSMRFNPAVQKAKELYEQGILGKLLRIHVYYGTFVSKDIPNGTQKSDFRLSQSPGIR